MELMTRGHRPGVGVSPGTPAADPERSRSIDGLIALGGGTTEPVARFRFDAVDNTWWWSPAMYALHGFSPGEVVPTTALLMAHKHADDRARTEGRLRAVAAHWGAVLLPAPHRRRRRSGAPGAVAGGAGTCDENGTVVAVQGYFIDVTESLRRAVEEEAHAAVTRATQTRAVIEQAKGILMGVYRIDPDAAFNLLRWHSQHTNTKIRVLAEGLVRHISETLGRRAQPGPAAQRLPRPAGDDRPPGRAGGRPRPEDAGHPPERVSRPPAHHPPPL